MLPPETIWTQWAQWELLLKFKHYLDTSPIFAFYERPFITTLWAGWPWWPIALTVLYAHYAFTISGKADKVKEYDRGEPGSGKAFTWAYFGLLGYLLLGTLSGSQYHWLMDTWRQNPTVVPQKLPPKPAPPPPYFGNNGVYDPRYVVRGPQVDKLIEMRITTNMLRTSLDFFILLSPVFLICVFFVLGQFRFYVFALAYSRELARRHLPSEIVDRALAGERIDNRALADALTSSTAPVHPDSLADKVEREKLRALAERLEGDASALNDKLSKEAEIARLVVSHARKREELADMERKLQDLGVEKHGKR